MTDGQTDGRTTDRLWYKINIPYFSNQTVGITKNEFNMNQYLYEPHSENAFNAMIYEQKCSDQPTQH